MSVESNKKEMERMLNWNLAREEMEICVLRYQRNNSERRVKERRIKLTMTKNQ